MLKHMVGFSVFLQTGLSLPHHRTPSITVIIIIIMSLTPVSSSNKDIGGVPSMQSSYLQKRSEMGYAWKRGVSIVSA